MIPRTTAELPVAASGAFRAITRSLVETAVITGVVLRLGRSLLLSWLEPGRMVAFGVVYLLGTVWLLGMLTLHLSNFTVRRWLWRAPLFTLVAVAAELLTSLALTAAGREPWGTESAHLHDWPSIARQVLLLRTVLLLPYALLLAAVVQGVRAWMARGERRRAASSQ